MTRQQWFRLLGLALGLRGTTTALLPLTGIYGGPEAKEEAERASDLATAAKLLADDLYRLVDTLKKTRFTPTCRLPSARVAPPSLALCARPQGWPGCP
jgi:hypothetical protein